MYEKQTWTARTGTGLNKFANSGTAEHLILTPEPDIITNEGTPFSAERMNHMEEGIYRYSRFIGSTVQPCKASAALSQGDVIDVCGDIAVPSLNKLQITKERSINNSNVTSNTLLIKISDAISIRLYYRYVVSITREGNAISANYLGDIPYCTSENKGYIVNACAIPNMENAFIALYRIDGDEECSDLYLMPIEVYNGTLITHTPTRFLGDIENDAGALLTYINYGMCPITNTDIALFRRNRSNNYCYACSAELTVESSDNIATGHEISITMREDEFNLHSGATSNIDCKQIGDNAALVVFTGSYGEIKCAKVGINSNALSAAVSPITISGSGDVVTRLALTVKGKTAPWNAVVVYSTQNGTNLKAVPLTINASAITVGTIATPTSGKSIKNYDNSTDAVIANHAGIYDIAYARINAMYIDSASNIIAVYYLATNNIRNCALLSITSSTSSFIAMHTLPDNDYYSGSSNKNMGLAAIPLAYGLMLAETSLRHMALMSYAQPKAIADSNASAGDTIYGVYDGTVYDLAITAGMDISSSGVKAHAYIDGCLSVSGWWKS